MGVLSQGPESSGRSGSGNTRRDALEQARSGTRATSPAPLDDGTKRMSPLAEALMGKYRTVSQTARLKRITGPFVASYQQNYGLNRESARKIRKG